jgi:hypothetical protein
MIRKIVLFSICVCLISAQAAVESPAADARLSELRISNRNNDFVVYLNVTGAFTEEMKSAILSGVPATFSFLIILSRTRPFWPDRTVADLTFTHTVKYNTLRKELVVRRSWEDNGTHVVKSLDEARRLMTVIEDVPIIPLRALERGARYQLRAKAELGRITLPLYLHYVLFFISLWDFETDWYTIDFIY